MKHLNKKRKREKKERKKKEKKARWYPRYPKILTWYPIWDNDELFKCTEIRKTVDIFLELWDCLAQVGIVQNTFDNISVW
jgi:hypothetical protein